MKDYEQEYYISRHETTSWPFSLDDIKRKLKRREISTLHKIQVDGQWELLRGFLASAKREKISVKRTHSVGGTLEQHDTEAVPLTIAINKEHDVYSPNEDGAAEPDAVEQRAHEPGSVAIPSRGFGMASFVLSLFFFLPGINFVCFILALIFGHLALSKTPSPMRKDQNMLPWFGIFHTYIHSLYIIATLAIASYYLSDFALESLSSRILIETHAKMIGNALGACILAGLLMVAIRMIADYFPKYYVCYIVSLLPSSLAIIIQTVIEINYVSHSKEKTVVTLLAGCVVLLVTATMCALLIRDKEGEELGYARALLASIFCIIVYVFGVILIVAYLASLLSSLY
jgi:hypothetical protein